MTDGGQDRFVDTLEDLEDGGQKAAILQRELGETDFGAVFNADLPDETRAVLLRASDDGDLSASETATVARKLDESGNGDVLRTVRDLDETEQRRALKLVAETDDDGIRLLDEVEPAQFQTLADNVDSTDGLARLSRQFDAGTVNSRHLDEMIDLLDSGDMDGADLRRFSEILEQRDSNPLIDDSIEADDLLDVASENKLSETRLLVKRNDDLIRLQTGDSDSGLTHIEGRHIDGDIVRRQQGNGKKSGAASFFPTGREITVGGKTNKLPDKMGDQDVQELIYETVEKGAKDPGSGDRIQYTLKPSEHGHDYGIERVKVIVEDESVFTAFPKSGDSIEKWSFPADDWV